MGRGCGGRRIIKIDKAGPLCAAATVMIAAGGQAFVDHLSLLKLQGKWMIVRNAPARNAPLPATLPRQRRRWLHCTRDQTARDCRRRPAASFCFVLIPRVRAGSPV